MKAILYFVFILFLINCRSVPRVTEKTDTLVREVVIEKLRDTTITIPPDSAWLQALLECDSAGNVLLKKIEGYEAGQNLKPPQIAIENNVLTVLSSADSLAIYLTLKDRYTIRDTITSTSKSKTIVKNRPTGWQIFGIWLINSVMMFAGYLIYKKVLRK